MKTFILAGGYGTRLSEETHSIPKPMVEVGGKPILWHIMKLYSHHGFNEFVILLGYRGHLIKEYFANFFLYQSDVTIDLQKNNIQVHRVATEAWKVTLVDTGLSTLTGGRLLRAREHSDGQPFFLTYGDGVANIDMTALLEFHRSHNGVATMTSVLPEGRYGSVEADSDGTVKRFVEKPRGDRQWINGGFFVFNPEIFEYLPNCDQTSLEREPIKQLAEEGRLFTYRHRGYWKCMDTLRDKYQLENEWQAGRARWKIWND